MQKKKIAVTALNTFALLIMLVMAYQAMPQDAAQPYPHMAPIDQYLMADQNAEISLARTAAPDSISRDAEVLVLRRHGFATAVPGKNGFVCVVERSWTAAADPDFWNPKVRVPICYSPAAAHSFLARILKRTGLILAGRTPAQTDAAIAAAVDNKELPAIEPGAMCYMMSKLGFGGDTNPHWPSHLMFYFPLTEPAIWGANLPGSPVVAMSDAHEHLTEFVIPVQRWSDGTQN